MLFVTKYVVPEWWFPTPSDFKPVTVPIERTAEQEVVPDPVVAVPTPLPPQPQATEPLPAEPEKPAHIPLWQKNAVPVQLEPGMSYVAIVIDDMGVNVAKSREMLEMPSVLTLSFLPYAHDVAAMTLQAHEKGHELMVHIPMEPLDPTINAGEDVLKVSLSPEELMTAIDSNLSKFSGYIGINNHMGSRFTQDVPALQELMKILKQRELLLLDSKTIAGSKAYALAKIEGVPALERDIFLDDDPSLPAVRYQLERLEHVAEKRGTAIAIGHPKADTIAALKEWLPTLAAKGIQIVPLSALAMSPAPENAVQPHLQPSAPQLEPSAPSLDTHSQDHSLPLSQPLPVYESSHP